MNEKSNVLLILEDENGVSKRENEINEIMKEFAEELKPIGIACKNWAKPS